MNSLEQRASYAYEKSLRSLMEKSRKKTVISMTIFVMSFFGLFILPGWWAVLCLAVGIIAAHEARNATRVSSHWQKQIADTQLAFDEFRCDICKCMRPNNRISVISYAVKGSRNLIRNLKFCSDRKECREGAEEMEKIGKC